MLFGSVCFTVWNRQDCEKNGENGFYGLTPRKTTHPPRRTLPGLLTMDILYDSDHKLGEMEDSSMGEILDHENFQSPTSLVSTFKICFHWKIGKKFGKNFEMFYILLIIIIVRCMITWFFLMLVQIYGFIAKHMLLWNHAFDAGDAHLYPYQVMFGCKMSNSFAK